MWAQVLAETDILITHGPPGGAIAFRHWIPNALSAEFIDLESLILSDRGTICARIQLCLVAG